jgi:putative transposase
MARFRPPVCHPARAWRAIVRRVLQIVALRVCSNDFKELEIVVLRHELAILRRRTRRPPLTWTDRLFLAASSRFLPRARWRSFLITQATLFACHRRLVAKRLTYARPPGRPPVRREIRDLALRLARDNPRWGYQRIVGELKGLGFVVSATAVRTWLRKAGLGPVGTRRGMTWREFLRAHRRSMLAVDFFYRRDDLAATAVCALLHRTGQPPSPCRGMHVEPERPVADTAGPTIDVDRRNTPSSFGS